MMKIRIQYSNFQVSSAAVSLMVNVPRPRELDAVGSALRHVPITALFGPSQCGKTTSARSLQTGHFFDLEDPRSFARQNARQTGLEGLTGMVVID